MEVLIVVAVIALLAAVVVVRAVRIVPRRGPATWNGSAATPGPWSRA